VAREQATLDDANVEAWGVYQQLNNRFAVDFGMVPDLFRAVVAGWAPEDVTALLERLDVMHAVLNPPPPPPE
jgi:hypothetical protein